MPNNPLFLNHLAQEKSPYLLQHAHNPVDWYPWDEVAFARARAQDKPILLSIGYSTCHWCHVMAHESFEDEGVAKIINEHFVAIKVDREERPDIDHIYMTAVTAMTGQGGWPLTAFLTPQGEPFYGGTYFPPYAKWGSIGFIDLLQSISQGWRQERENILSSGRSITESLRAAAQRAPGNEVLDQAAIDMAWRQLRGQYDSVNPGFGSAPKFPLAHHLSFLMRYYKDSHQDEALGMSEAILKAMARGGIRDHLGGGFHRYSTDARWHVPHFEKMLYDQAVLSQAYLDAYQLTGDGFYAEIAIETLEYVLRDMTDPQGGFYSAEDADSLTSTDGHLVEGAFYVFAENEINEVLGLSDAQIFNDGFGVKPHGNAENDPHGEFINKNILFVDHSSQEIAEKFNRQIVEIEDILKRSQEKLFLYRNRRPRPHKDDKVLCDWNGLMIASFAAAGRILGEVRYTRTAALAADFIWENLYRKDGLLHRWRQGDAGIRATLEDYAFLTYGLLAVYEATFEIKYLERAQILVDEMLESFQDEAGGFYMTARGAEDLILRPKEIYDGVVPSGNSVAAICLLKLYTLTKKGQYLSIVEGLLRFFSSTVSRAPYAHTFLLQALGWHLQGALEITFEGRADDATIAKMLKVVYKHFVPYKTVQLISASGKTQVQLCFKGTCHQPIDNSDLLDKELTTL